MDLVDAHGWIGFGYIMGGIIVVFTLLLMGMIGMKFFEQNLFVFLYRAL